MASFTSSEKLAVIEEFYNPELQALYQDCARQEIHVRTLRDTQFRDQILSLLFEVPPVTPEYTETSTKQDVALESPYQRRSRYLVGALDVCAANWLQDDGDPLALLRLSRAMLAITRTSRDRIARQQHYRKSAIEYIDPILRWLDQSHSQGIHALNRTTRDIFEAMWLQVGVPTYQKHALAIAGRGGEADPGISEVYTSTCIIKTTPTHIQAGRFPFERYYEPLAA